MKKTLLALPLLAFGLPAFANTGLIQFTGQVVAGSCPIEIRDPAGATGGAVDMGQALVGDFNAAGIKKNHTPFTISVTDASQCPGWDGNGGASNVGVITLTGTSGSASNGDLFALKPGAGTASNLALGITDYTGAVVKHGDDSAPYPLNDGMPTDMAFTAYYESLAANVTAGDANVDVALKLTIN
ncbi:MULTISPECIES: fimbrial protein [unclassified Pseudomonas]|uniref:fimbrial protein n=1 Tax=unclassified Pseudomonas TaxID=196821 RepID=UPI000BD3C61B|nr:MULTISPECIES: fimbrial protein [unclassified Pseudomonas]PVZ16416.1 major type 1 subunit fimbrin (pilin) [Pseudomonas sp. URIL14HWK12:I12]PVZ25728.1 major type 1 subunit fimbrin (pilin) [Pseudomonas sp. URIL14HWK12:I10]PVZ36748.1 major type 1 subunit fimbrin (pilin) [Pseudomonas sp. URIL14HWK12:I11]SNZ12692.1 major type 1 subunit fimbrin (pilin) [Pseudomonas sp. URIL14HWK12:I9]